MPDFLAIVSKAVFEKAARGLGPGDCWPTALYASTHAALAPLASGGDLFLATVRPGAVLWLVAILRRPTGSSAGWRAKDNVVPITDVTSLIPTVSFANGKGLVRDAKLGMSLQTPRELSPTTADALRAIAIGKPVAAPTAAPTEPVAAKQKSKPTKKPAANSERGPRGKTKATAADTGWTLDAVHAALAPVRADAVPATAIWNAAAEAWEDGTLDERGARQGVWRAWRDDGSVRGECAYVDHEPHGSNRRFHPDGQLASEGQWTAGVLGDTICYAHAGDSDEIALLEGGEATVRAAYVAGADGRSNVTIRFYDAAGAQRDHVGVLVPARPSHVPDTARWFSDEKFGAPDGSIGGWVDGAIERERGRKLGTWRWWTTAGELLRTEVYTPSGRHQATIIPGNGDPIAAVIDRYFEAPKAGYHDLARAWSPEVHATMRARLPGAPSSMTREYLSLLYRNLEEHYAVWTRKIRKPRHAIEVVDDWEARTPADAADVDAWFILGAGARAAYLVRDRERLARWWKRFIAIPAPKERARDTYSFNGFDDDLGPKAEMRAAITALLDGGAAKAHAARVKQLSVPVTFASVTDDELADLVSAAAKSAPCSVLVRDAATCEAWLIDEEHHTHYWNGREVAKPTVTFDDRPNVHLAYIAPADACDERVLHWPGKHGWLALQRYGRAVLWHAATFYSSRGQAEVEQLLWFKASTPAEARQMMVRIANARSKASKPINPWATPKLGVIRRGYKGDGLAWLGVNDCELVTRAGTLERFASHGAAVVAFEKIELERLRSGDVISRFQAAANDD